MKFSLYLDTMLADTYMYNQLSPLIEINIRNREIARFLIGTSVRFVLHLYLKI